MDLSLILNTLEFLLAAHQSKADWIVLCDTNGGHYLRKFMRLSKILSRWESQVTIRYTLS